MTEPPQTKNTASLSLLSTPLTLPCGVVLKNRLIKAAMSDSLGNGEGNPTSQQIRLYERWAKGGVALSIIGEVQGDCRYPEKPGNLVLLEKDGKKGLDRQLFQSLAQRGSVNGCQLWPQLGHAGALAHKPVCPHLPKGPSPLDIKAGLQCQGMSLEEIHELPEMYARAATMAKELGFGGVLLHAGHGFLLSQFLSPLFNHRTDAYGGGTVEGRFRIIGEIIDAVRQVVGSAFPVGIKINSTDQLVGGLTEEDAFEVVRLLDSSTSIDLIDVSGGTYFPGASSSSDRKSHEGPYFVEFAKRAKQITSIPVAATGGFRSREQAVAALESGSVDAVGLARAMCLEPDLPNLWLNNNNTTTTTGLNPVFPRFESPVPPGGITAWYSMRLTALGQDKEDQFEMSLPEALKVYDDRDAERCKVWRKRFLVA